MLTCHWTVSASGNQVWWGREANDTTMLFSSPDLTFAPGRTSPVIPLVGLYSSYQVKIIKFNDDEDSGTFTFAYTVYQWKDDLVDKEGFWVIYIYSFWKKRASNKEQEKKKWNMDHYWIFLLAFHWLVIPNPGLVIFFPNLSSPHLCRMFSASHPVAAWINSSTPVTLNRMQWS